MPRVSGKDGDLSLGGNELTRVVGWTLDYEVDIHSGAHSDSDNWEESTSGNRRWSGSGTVEADEGTVPTALAAAILAGDAVAFKGTAYDGQDYTGSVVLGGATGIGADIKGGIIEEITYPFSGSGVLTIPTT